jgi:hypothetical protein
MVIDFNHAAELVRAGNAQTEGDITDDLGEVYGVLTRFDTQETCHVGPFADADEYRDWKEL